MVDAQAGPGGCAWGALLVVGNDTAVGMSTVALNHRRELCLTLRGAAENPILTTFITDQYAAPMVRAMRKRTFASICPDVEHVSRLRAPPPPSDQNPRRRCVPCFDAVQPRAYSVSKRTCSNSTSSGCSVRRVCQCGLPVRPMNAYSIRASVMLTLPSVVRWSSTESR
jgi:hypothetical protein